MTELVLISATLVYLQILNFLIIILYTQKGTCKREHSILYSCCYAHLIST